MTQPSRTTETINRDNAAIRDIMHQIRELTVPDRATLALGLVGHLATMMNRSQMTKLMGQLQEEAERVQDVPPSRQREDDPTASTEPGDDPPAAGPAEDSRERMAAEWTSTDGARGEDGAGRDARRGSSADPANSGEAGGGRSHSGSPKASSRGGRQDDRMAASRTSQESPPRGRPRGDVLGEQVPGSGRGSHEGVGQEGRGEFRSGKLL